MNELVPCPECQRHVRKAEASCPFCGEALSLAHLPPAVLPTRRLGRAATFAFGAGVVGATALVGCSDGSDDLGGGGMAIYGAPAAGMSAGGNSAPHYGAPPSGATNGGATNGGNMSQGGGAQPVYGAPAAGTGNEPNGGASGAGGAGGAAGDDNIGGVYGAPAGDGGGGAGGAP